MDEEGRGEKNTTVWTRKVEARMTQLYDKEGRSEKVTTVWTRKVEVRKTQLYEQAL